MFDNPVGGRGQTGGQDPDSPRSPTIGFFCIFIKTSKYKRLLELMWAWGIDAETKVKTGMADVPCATEYPQLAGDFGC